MIDLLYLCHGRLEFTKATLANLDERTDWSLVDNFVIYNDATPEQNHQTTRFLREYATSSGLEFTIRETNLGSPVGVMNHFLNRSTSEIFAKIDNDIIVSNSWLPIMLGVMEENPDLELLGAEPGQSGRKPLTVDDGASSLYGYVDCSHIGGVGLMRHGAFERYGYPVPNGRFGFTEWQHTFMPKRGWICPDLRLFSLDMLPVEPWKSITDNYRHTSDLQRDWPLYDPRWSAHYYNWWTG